MDIIPRYESKINIHAISNTKQIKVFSPKHMVVKSTTTNVVVTMTFLTSSSNSR